MEETNQVHYPTEEQNMYHSQPMYSQMQPVTHQPMEDMEVETSYQDTMQGTKYPVSETVEVSVDNNQIVITDTSRKEEMQPVSIIAEEIPNNSQTARDIQMMISGKPQLSPTSQSQASEDHEEFEIDRLELDRIIHDDPDKIPVKKMRKLVPKLRMHCYKSEEDIKAKRKHKHLWDEKPEDWPETVPFKDPNNKGRDGKEAKPGKEILTRMFLFLRNKYIREKEGKGPMEMIQESPVHRQLHHPSEEVEARDEKAQEPIVVDDHTPVQVEQPQQQSVPQMPVADPVSGLYRRIEEKIKQVEILVGDNQECREALFQVFQDIIKALYIQSKAITMCGYFLDAGHDLENLLDKGLAFGKLLDASIIMKGCLLIVKKYQSTQRSGNLQNVTTPIYRCEDATPRQMVRNRLASLTPSVPTRLPQTVSDGVMDVCKKEPLSPGKPFSPATQLAHDMSDVKIKEEPNYDLEEFGITSKGNAPNLLSGVVDVRSPPVEGVNLDIFGKSKEDYSKPLTTDPVETDQAKSEIELDLMKIMQDIQKDVGLNSDTGLDLLINDTHKHLTAQEPEPQPDVFTNENLCASDPATGISDDMADLLSILQKECPMNEFESNLMGANDVTDSVAQPTQEVNQSAPDLQQTGIALNPTFNLCALPQGIPTTVENYVEPEQTRTAGGKAATPRARTRRQSRTGKGRGKYQRI